MSEAPQPSDGRGRGASPCGWSAGRSQRGSTEGGMHEYRNGSVEEGLSGRRVGSKKKSPVLQLAWSSSGLACSWFRWSSPKFVSRSVELTPQRSAAFLGGGRGLPPLGPPSCHRENIGATFVVQVPGPWQASPQGAHMRCLPPKPPDPKPVASPTCPQSATSPTLRSSRQISPRLRLPSSFHKVRKGRRTRPGCQANKGGAPRAPS